MQRLTHIDTASANRSGKIIAAVIVALAVIGVGTYGYEQGMFRPSSPVADNELPNPGAPLVR